MKLLLGLCLVICFVGAHCEDMATIMMKRAQAANPHIAECMAESKVDTRIIEDMQKNNAISNAREMQCYLACMMKKEKAMNADGALSQRFMEDSRTESCRNLGGKDSCEVAFKIVECMLKADPPK